MNYKVSDCGLSRATDFHFILRSVQVTGDATRASVQRCSCNSEIIFCSWPDMSACLAEIALSTAFEITTYDGIEMYSSSL